MPDQDGGPPHPGAAAIMAGFITWLVPQRLREEHEQSILQEVERFLRWHYQTHDHPRPRLKRSSWNYLDQMNRNGTGKAQQQTTWSALLYLLAYESHTRASSG